MKKKRVMVNPVPDSDEVIGYNRAIHDVIEKLKEKV